MLPDFWGTPLPTCPALRPRGVKVTLAMYGSPHVAFRLFRHRRPRDDVLSRLHHAACGLAVYVSSDGSPHRDARLATSLLARR